jgi:high-affinity Fe2+/Pb2+ permease
MAFGRPKERQRFYLLPGMGGSNLRRKRRRIMQWSIVAGLFTSALLACLLYWLGKR